MSIKFLIKSFKLRLIRLANHKKLLFGLLSGLVLFTFVFYIAVVDPKLGKAAQPEVASNSANDITQVAATLTGEVTSNGGQPLTVRGFEYGTSLSYGNIVSDTNSDAYSFAYSWGSIGSGNGQFSSQTGPEGIAKDSAGNVYVVDGGNHRIQKFSASGTYISQFGSNGQGNGQFNFPHGISIDSADNIYVADTSNNRIQKFNSSGVYQTQFGGPVYFGGTGSGQMRTPNDVAVDLSGNVFVTDSGNNRIQKFTSNGALISVIGNGGTGNGQFNGLLGIDNDVDGNIYVVDGGNSRVQKLNNNGVYLTKWGSYGSGDGQFHVPAGITLDNLGYVYVVDGHNHRVQKFTTNGNYVTQFGSLGSGNTNFYYPVSIFTDNVGGVFVSDVGNRKVKKFTPTISTGTFSMPVSGLACGTLYHYRAFSVNDTETGNGDDATFTTTSCGTPTARTVGASTITSDAAALSGQITGLGDSDLMSRGFEYGVDTNYGSTVDDLSPMSYQFKSKFGSSGSGSDNLSNPQSTVSDSAGNIYVADTNNHRIKKYDNNGNHLMTFGYDVIPGGSTGLETCTTSCKAGVAGNGNGQLNSPQGIAVDESGNIYVTDWQNDRIEVFDSTGAYKYKFGTTGTGPSNFNRPNRITLDKLRNIYVADTNNHRIKKYDNNGNHLMTFGYDVIPGGSTGLETCTTSCKAGVAGNGNGQLNSPQGMQVDGNGAIYVADTYNHRLQKFNSNGSYALKFGTAGTGNDNLIYPQDLVINSAGNIYVTDFTDLFFQQNNRVQIFNSSGVRISQLGSSGTGDGNFDRPTGIAIDTSGNIFVSDNQNRIQKFDFLVTASLTNLDPNTTYHFRAYATNSAGTAVGSDSTFTTSDDPKEPTAVSINASSIGLNSATINGEVTSIGTSEITARGFEYGLTETYGTRYDDLSLTVGQYSFIMDNLLCGTEYHYRAFATNSVGDSYGSDLTFTTLDCLIPPQTTTGSAASITANSATLDGDVVNSGSSAITARGFDYGLTEVYGSLASQNSSNTGTYSLVVSSLICATTYHFRSFATSSVGTSYGTDKTFTTSACPVLATLTTQSASSVGLSSATLNGNISDLGNTALTARGFEYGATSNLGSTSNDSVSSTGSYSFSLSGINCGTTYHFRAYATNSVGTSRGSIQTFTTVACPIPPSVTTNSATSVTSNTAVLNGTVNTVGSSPITAVGFKYGSTQGNYPGTTNQNTANAGAYNSAMNLLNCGTTYHYVAYATNSVGTVQGEDSSFTTNTCPVVTVNSAPVIINQLKTTKDKLVEPATVFFTIQVKDDDKVSKVELFKGNDLVGLMKPSDVDDQYDYIIKDIKSGVYSYSAKITDNGNPALSLVSSPVTIIVGSTSKPVNPEANSNTSTSQGNQNSQNSDKQVYTPVAIRDKVPDPIVGTVESIFKVADRAVEPVPVPAAKALPYTTIAILGIFASIYTYQALGQARSRRRILGLAKRFKDTEERRKTYIDLTSHYLNTPITTMQSSIELLESLKVVPKKTIDPIKKMIRQLTDHAKSLLRLSDSLSTESKATTKIISDASKGHLLTSVGFIVPVVGVLIIALILNLLFVWAKKYDSNIVNILVQTGLYFLGVVGITASYLLLKRNKVSALTAEQELRLEKDFAESQTKFITDSGSLLYKDVQQIGKFIPKIQDAPHGKTFVSGFDALKKAVLKIAYLNKLSTSEHTQKVTSHEIESILNEILLEYQPIALKNLVNLRTSIQPNLTAKIDTEGLKQLLTSTLDNAIKFTNEGGDINLSVKELKSGKVSIVVEDTGSGIPKDKIDHLFIPFSRGTDTRKFDYAGLGLDLYMDKLVVDQVDGRISVKSKEGAGTRVAITLDP